MIEEDNTESCIYGIQITMANLINFAIAFSIGFWMKEILEIAIFYVIFVSMRFFCGGYHAKSYCRCFCLFAITCFSYLVLINKIMLHIENTSWLWIMTMLLLGISILIKAPIEHENRPFTADERRLFRKRSIQLYLMWSFVGMILLLLGLEHLSVCFASVFLMICFYMVMERRKENEKESA